jgi:hypothetical protein
VVLADETPIFASVSAWFRPDLVGSGAAGPLGSQAYASPADHGWSAAAAVSARRHNRLTAAGLPRRQPMTALLPGTADETADTAASRDADAVRGRLAGYQAGLRAARTTRLRPETRGA